MLERGVDGLVHGNRGRPSARKLDEQTRANSGFVGPGGRYRAINDCHWPNFWPRRRASVSGALLYSGCSELRLAFAQAQTSAAISEQA